MPHDLSLPGADAKRAPDPDLLRLRLIHRAAGDLRRGIPVILRLDPLLVVLAAETASAGGLGEMAALTTGSAVLVISPIRAAALLRRAVQPKATAVGLRTGRLFDAAVLRGLADPTAEQIIHEPIEATPAPPGADAAIALAKIARLLPALLVAPLRQGAERIVAERSLLTIEAADVLSHPDREAALLTRVAEAHVPLEDAPDARVIAFRAPDGGIEHLAILIGQPEHADIAGPAPLVRLHSECFTGDLLGSLRCDCGPQLRAALRRMGNEGSGVLLYLAQEGRGIGLASKLRAYALQDRGLDTVDANRALGWNVDERNFMVAATMLTQLGIGTVRLLTNNPAKIASLSACGIDVAGREPLVVAPNGVNDHYLATKTRRLGHLPE